jgi:hypothetical protein
MGDLSALPPLLFWAQFVILVVAALVEFVSLLWWRRRIRAASRRKRLLLAIFSFSDLLVGGLLLLLFPQFLFSTRQGLFEFNPLFTSFILLIALLLLTAGIGKVFLMLITRSRPAVLQP